MLIDFNFLKEKYNLNIEGVLHIGAHYGKEIDLYFKTGIKNIVCFEPIKTNFEILQKNGHTKSDLFNIALGNENKEIKMYVETLNNGQSCSILKPFLHLSQYPSITFDSQINVKMMKLDDFMLIYKSNSQNYNKKFNFINIDVQGYELEVFKGAQQTLNNIEYIYTEVNIDYLYENCVLIGELDLFLSKFGFKRVETNLAGHSWGDAFYIKNNI